MAILASGRGPDGAVWELDVEGGAHDLHTMVSVTLLGGHSQWGMGCGGPATHHGERVNVFVGVGDRGPRTFIARVTSDVRAVVVTLSDGTREDLVLYGNHEQLGARIAVLVYRRDLDIHRVDLVGFDGATLANE